MGHIQTFVTFCIFQWSGPVGFQGALEAVARHYIVAGFALKQVHHLATGFAKAAPLGWWHGTSSWEARIVIRPGAPQALLVNHFHLM